MADGIERDMREAGRLGARLFSWNLQALDIFGH